MSDVIKQSNEVTIANRKLILEFEDAIRSMQGAVSRQDDPEALDKLIPVTDYIIPGVYAREIFIPKGAMVTGQIHKYQQINILTVGEMTVHSDGETKRVKAPYTVITPPGTKRAAIAHEDSRWITIVASDWTDTNPDEIMGKVTTDSFEEFDAFIGGE